MSTLRKTVTWMLLLAGFGAAGGGAYFWQLLKKTDAIARAQLEQALLEQVPDWVVTFEDVHVDLSGTARVTDVTLRLRERSDALVQVPLLVARLDRELLKQSQMLRIERVTL